MIPFRPWYTLGRCTPLLFAAPIVFLFIDGSLAGWCSSLSVLVLVVLGLHGAYLGLKLCRGPVLMSCPFCQKPGEIGFSKGIGIHLNCPRCGTVRGEGPFGARLKAGPLSLPEREGENAGAGTPRFSDYAQFSPWAYLLVLAPPAATIIAASQIHHFAWFHLLIPGVWCLFVGLHLFRAYKSGVIEDNTGRFMRRHRPFRFWLNFAIWTAAYLFAAGLPIAFALQEAAAGR